MIPHSYVHTHTETHTNTGTHTEKKENQNTDACMVLRYKSDSFTQGAEELHGAHKHIRIFGGGYFSWDYSGADHDTHQTDTTDL